jgi:hypothetical protein
VDDFHFAASVLKLGSIENPSFFFIATAEARFQSIVAAEFAIAAPSIPNFGISNRLRRMLMQADTSIIF